jgi:hypothetical protein
MTHFRGFTIPKGAWIPPEIAQILPMIDTLAELKVILAALYDACQVGRAGSALSLAQLERLSGLSRTAVIDGRNAATARGILQRRKLGGQYFYQLTITASAEFAPGSSKLLLRSSNLLPHVVNTLQSLSEQQQHTYKALADFGVNHHVARSLVITYEPEYIEKHLAFARAAANAELSDNPPGWLISSLREDWQEPLVTTTRRQHRRPGQVPKTWYSEEESKHFVQT